MEAGKAGESEGLGDSVIRIWSASVGSVGGRIALLQRWQRATTLCLVFYFSSSSRYIDDESTISSPLQLMPLCIEKPMVLLMLWLFWDFGYVPGLYSPPFPLHLQYHFHFASWIAIITFVACPCPHGCPSTSSQG